MRGSEFRYIDQPDILYREGLRAATGSYAITKGLFRPVIVLDPTLHDLPGFVVAFVVTHEAFHRIHRHGLWSALFFFVAPLLRPMFEAQADRYAIERVGRANALRAMMILMPIARSQAEARVYGRDATERMARAGG